MALHCHIHGQHPKRHKNTLVPKTCNDHPVNLLTILPLKLSPPGRLLSLWLAWIGVKWNNGCCSFCLVSCVEMASVGILFPPKFAGSRAAPSARHISARPATHTTYTIHYNMYYHQSPIILHHLHYTPASPQPSQPTSSLISIIAISALTRKHGYTANDV